MIVAPLHRYFSPAHLVEVMAEMRWRGAPVIRAYLDEPSGAWLAMEGTHRLRAAHLLELVPDLIPVPWWRTMAALERARFAAIEYGYAFPVTRRTPDSSTALAWQWRPMACPEAHSFRAGAERRGLSRERAGARRGR